MRFTRNQRGSVLAEAMVSVTTLIAAVVAVSTIINNAIAATAISKDYLVAENLLKEGVAAIDIVRDTNLMMWPEFKDKCWLVSDPVNNADPGVGGINCQGRSVLAQTNYIATSTGGRWKLATSNTGDLNLSGIVGAQAPYLLNQKTLNQNGVQFNQYLHSPGNPPSKFYRSIKVDQVNILAGSAAFEIKVQWFDGSKVREIKQNYIISNNS